MKASVTTFKSLRCWTFFPTRGGGLGWNVSWATCSDLAAAAQTTQVTKQRPERVQAGSSVSPRRAGANIGSDTLGPCPRQDATSGTPLLQPQEEEEAPRDEGPDTAGPHQATQTPEGKSEGWTAAPKK